MLRLRPALKLVAAWALLAAVLGQAQAGDTVGPRLAGIALLPAATVAQGPLSGTQLGVASINGRQVPIQGQPVQGLSAIVDNRDGTYWALSDNGFGSIANSADYHLRLYKIAPDFLQADGGAGTVQVLEYLELRDPDRQIDFPIVNGMTKERVLTGADLDPESLQRAPDGSIWIGEEFGPFLLHFDAHGVLLEPPIRLPDVREAGQGPICSPQSPDTEEGVALRLMNALRTHAQASGGQHTPVCAPWAGLVADEDPTTFAASRRSPTAGVGAASSDIFDLASLRRAGFPVVVWTVNRQATMTRLIRMGVDGIVSDRPDLLLRTVKEYDADGDGRSDLVTAQGLIDREKLDAQGHGGGGGLRPDNTLPAVEAALDNLMTTLQLDLGLTRDGVLVVSHDPQVATDRCRCAWPGEDYDEAVLIRDLTAAEIQDTFVCDRLLPAQAAQSNDLALSPVAAAFAEQTGLPHPYAMPKLQDVLDFVLFYAQYYERGAGADQPGSDLRAANARQVRFSLETRLNPRAELADRSADAEAFADAVAALVIENKMAGRVDVQSLDFRPLLYLHEKYPDIRTVFLFGDWPTPEGDGANLQPDETGQSPWLAGASWPYRRNKDDCAGGTFRAQSSGGLEGLALTVDGRRLLALLEKPLAGDPDGLLLIHEFDLASSQFSGRYYLYPLDERGTAASDFLMYSDHEGLVLERDDSQGNLGGFKAIFKITLGEPGEVVDKERLVDLLNVRDPDGLAARAMADKQVIGVGETYAFPFVTIDGLFVVDETHIGVLNDNNYPFSVGRHLASGAPDDTELILVELPQVLALEGARQAASAQTITFAAIGDLGTDNDSHTQASVDRTPRDQPSPAKETPPAPLRGTVAQLSQSGSGGSGGAVPALVMPIGMPDCTSGDGVCFERPLAPDCVDDGAICLYEVRTGPLGRGSYRPWRPDEQPHYGQLQYVRVDLSKGARLENLLAGQPYEPKVFCWRAASHADLDDPAGPFPFLAWSDFDPLLSEPASRTVIERNERASSRHLHLLSVRQFAQRQDASGRPPVFVLNGSYFSPETAPEGSQWRSGRMLRVDPNRTMVAFSRDGRRAEILWGDGTPIRYGQARELKPIACQKNDEGELEEVPQLAAGVDLSWVYTAIGGGPVFVLRDATDLDRAGRARVKVADTSVKRATPFYVPFNPLGEAFGQAGSPYEDLDGFEHRTRLYAQRSPRTFVCVGDEAVLLGTSKDMSGPELGRTLVELGCHTALSLDDNTSSSFFWRGRYGRALWKAERYRLVANAIGVYSRSPWPLAGAWLDSGRSGPSLETLDRDTPSVWVLVEQQLERLRALRPADTHD